MNLIPPSGRSRRTVLIAVIMATALLLVGCSAGTSEPEEAIDATVDTTLRFAAEDDNGVNPETQAFDFQAAELFTGEPVDGLSIINDNPTIVTFVDPNCPICVEEGPELAEVAADFADVNFVVIHGFAHTNAYLSYTDEADLYQENVIHIVDTDGALWKRFGVTSTPAALVVDHLGHVGKAQGALGIDGLTEAAELAGHEA